MTTPDHAVDLYRQGLDLIDAATDLDGLTAARTTLLDGVLALLEAAHQGGVYLKHLEREIDQLTASRCGDW